MNYTKEQLEELVLIFRREFYGVCFYCGQRMWGKKQSKKFPSSPTARTTDHVVPLSKMGSDEKRNKVPCCYRCNCLKADKTLEEFRLVFYGEETVEFYFEREIRIQGLKIEPQVNLTSFLGGVQNLDGGTDS